MQRHPGRVSHWHAMTSWKLIPPDTLEGYPTGGRGSHWGLVGWGDVEDVLRFFRVEGESLNGAAGGEVDSL